MHDWYFVYIFDARSYSACRAASIRDNTHARILFFLTEILPIVHESVATMRLRKTIMVKPVIWKPCTTENYLRFEPVAE
eukprot:COSAG05_NODE_116_length_17986_cov_348.987534_14_plen_79_part_00